MTTEETGSPLDTIFSLVDEAAQRCNMVLGGETRMALALDLYVRIAVGLANNKATTLPQINLVWPGKKS